MNIPLINSVNVNDINTSLIAIRKNMQKTSSGVEKLQDVDVDVNVNIAHNSLYCAADSTVIKGATLFQGCSIKVMFTSAITGSDTSTPLVINYNDVNVPVKTGKNGTLADFVAYNTGSGFVYCQAYTTLELLFDGNNFVIMGNPVVISNSDYTVYTDGSIKYSGVQFLTYTIPCPVGQYVLNVPYDKYMAIIFDTVRHTTYSAVFTGTEVVIGCIGSNYAPLNNDGVNLQQNQIVLLRESSAGDYIVSVSPVIKTN